MEAEKNGDKARKAQYKLMSNAVYRKTMIKLKKQNQFKTSKQQKRLSKIYIKTKLSVAKNI